MGLFTGPGMTQWHVNRILLKIHLYEFLILLRVPKNITDEAYVYPAIKTSSSILATTNVSEDSNDASSNSILNRDLNKNLRYF